jgi:hypothetical protein
MKKILLSIVLVLLFCTQSLAETSVWKVRKGNSVMYVGGTFHLLRQSDFPLPVEFDRAYKESDILVLETDLGEFKDPSMQQKLMSKAIYTDGSTIDQHLSPKTYKLLSEYCASNGLPLEMLKKFKPSIIAMMMEVLELTKMNVTMDGVDMTYYQSAKQDMKAVEGLETVDEQIDYVVEMGQGDEDAFVANTIKELKTIKQGYESMIGAWKKGDVKKLNDLMVAEIKKSPRLYKRLLTDRNQNWLTRIDAYQQTPEKEFILVGVAHLVGPDGILESLKRKGYKVEKL